jgi:hypothetical protein
MRLKMIQNKKCHKKRQRHSAMYGKLVLDTDKAVPTESDDFLVQVTPILSV